MKKANFALNNISERLRTKITLIFTLFSALGAVFGFLIVSGIFVARNHLTVVGYFDVFSQGVGSFNDFLGVVFGEVRVDAIRVFILTFAAVSLIDGFVTDVVVASSSFADSFLGVIVLRTAMNEALEPNVSLFAAVIYALFKISRLVLTSLFAYKAALVSRNIKLVASDGAIRLDKKHTLLLGYHFLFYLGLILIVEVLYCLILFFIN